MNFISAIISVWHNRNNFDGATSRSEFWYFQLFTLIISNFFILPLDAVIFSYQFHSPVSTLWIIFLMRINTPLIIRRLYDSGTATWKGLVVLIPVIGLPVLIHVNSPLWLLTWSLTIAIFTSYFIYLMQLKSWRRDQPRGIEKIKSLK